MTEKYNVLVVDDEPQVAAALTDLLENAYNVFSQTCPVSALEMLKEGMRVSVIISDQIMPGLTGDKFLAEAKKYSSAARILITGYADIGAVANAVNEGAIFGYLTKPWKPELVQSTVRNAVDYCELDRALRRERRMFNDLMRSVSDGVYFKDRDGRYLCLNEAEARFLGLSAPSDAIGKKLSEVLSMGESSHWRDAEEAVLRCGAGMSNIIRESMRDDKSRRICAINMTPVHNEEGDVTALIGVSRDVTEEKNIQQMKDEFVSTVSHELRTPLTAILGSLGLLRSGVIGELQKETADIIEISHNNCSRLLRLVNDILDMEKLNRGAIRIEYSMIDIASLLHEAVDANMGVARQQNQIIDLAKSIPEVCVKGDRDRLMQVLANLISNALKFSPPGGKIRLRASLNNGHIRIAVTDMGGGVPEGFGKRIFQRFSQADSSDARQKGGAGLGLNISRSIVELHGGVINYRTHQNMGTTFYFDLPIMGKNSQTRISA